MRRRAASLIAVAALFMGALVVPVASGAGPAAADTPSGLPPIAQRSAQGVTADALPTVQIDGVVWSEAVVGNTVYAGGSFANARPAGSAPGTSLTPRSNLLSFDLTTGNLNTSFAPSLNAQAMVVTASPDGSRIYVGGSFTTADGQQRDRIAAYSTATGQLISSFAPNLDSTVNAITATNTTVYVGGNFSTANGVARSHLAAFSAADGSLLGWAPTADDSVKAMVLTPDDSRVIVGGMFLNINGSPAEGLAALDATTGTLLPWAATNLIKEGGSGSEVSDLSTDGTAIYGTGWAYGSNISTLEGGWSADPDTGNINWIENCWGDTYGIFGVNGAVYEVSHHHACQTLGGYPDTNPRVFHQSMAFTAQATGTLGHDIGNPDPAPDMYGDPAPSIINWFPDTDNGTYTGLNEGTWSVSGNSQYVVEGGEFLHVNGVAQQGLVRFAVPSIAPDKQGPMVTGSQFVPSLVSLTPGTVRVAIQTNWDRDDKTLHYQVFRNGNLTNPVWTATADSEFWNRPTIGFTDTGLTPGATYQYRVFVSDGDGNTAKGDTATITLPTTTSQTAYDRQVISDGASSYWPLDEPSGTVFYDNAGFNDMDATAGVTRGVSGPVSGEAGSTFDGASDGTSATRTAVPGPNVFTLSAWVKTTSTTGGKIVGFGDAQTGTSSNYDRHLYLDNTGRVWFGVYNGTTSTLQSTNPINDGQWHQVVATLGPGGMALYVDGQQVASRSDVTQGQAYNGYWRIGGDNLNGWPSQPSSNFLAGSIADVAIFPTVLTGATIGNEYTVAENPPPSAAFTSSANLLTASFDGSGSSSAPGGSIASYSWDFGDGSAAGSGVTPQHTYAAPGTYQVTLTVTSNKGATSSVTHAVTVTSVIAADAFGRTTSSGWGTADTGGPWTVTGTASQFSVGGGVGTVNVGAAATGPTAYLNSVSQANVNAVVDASVSQSSGGGSYVELIGRHSGTSDYRLKVLYRADGTVQALISKVVSGTDTTLKSLVIPNLTYTPGTPLRIRFVVSGTGTTSLSGTVWPVGTTEPASPQISLTDSTAALQSAGSFGIQSYVTGTSTALPVVFTYDNLSVVPAS
jgi:PKD repeat protein